MKKSYWIINAAANMCASGTMAENRGQNAEESDRESFESGRIGLRHMFTRSARYANFRVSSPKP